MAPPIIPTGQPLAPPPPPIAPSPNPPPPSPPPADPGAEYKVMTETQLVLDGSFDLAALRTALKAQFGDASDISIEIASTGRRQLQTTTGRRQLQTTTGRRQLQTSSTVTVRLFFASATSATTAG